MGQSALLNFSLNQFVIFLKLYLSSIKKSFKLTVLKNSLAQTVVNGTLLGVKTTVWDFFLNLVKETV